MSSSTTIQQLSAALEALADQTINFSENYDGSDAVQRRAYAAARKLCQRLETPLELSRRLGWQEPSNVVAIKIALDLGLFNALQKSKFEEGATVTDLARTCDATVELVSRICRHLAAWGIIQEITKGVYAATPTSNALLDPKVNSGIDYWFDISARSHWNMPTFLKQPDAKSNWHSVAGQDFFPWMEEHPNALTAFQTHLAAFTDGRGKWIDIYPVQERLLSAADEAGPLIVDVGGGQGNDVKVFQHAFPQSPGRLFVQDLPSAIADARKYSTDSAIELQAHDFFTPQPILGSRAYLLHYVLHDWPDEKCLEILAQLKAAMKKGYSKLLVVELVVASENADPFNTALDITVMCVVGAKERTEEDWRVLFEKAEMQVNGIWTLPGDRESVIEIELV